MKRQKLFSVTKKDLQIDWFSGSGAGGQHRNKHQNCCRIKHPESGAIVTGQSNKSRQANIKEAFNNLIKHPKFKLWINLKIKEGLDGETLIKKVEKMMNPKNLVIEKRDENGCWVNYE